MSINDDVHEAKDRERVQFSIGETFREAITVFLKDGSLHIEAHGPVNIQPVASNYLVIELR